MQIQSNNSLFTQNRYNHINSELNKTLNKLSSGYKINVAADDAAGLSISEKMRGQIRGLNQAGENIQDGISLINTTEGGLGQIQNPNLVRIRELIIQAANDTNTPEDRQLIQQEIEALKRGIDDIANGTEFNTIKTLIPEDMKTNSNVSKTKFDIVFLIDDSSTMATDIRMVTQGLSTFSEKMNTVGDVRIASTSVVHSNRDLPATNDIEQVKEHLKNNHIATGGSTNPEQILSDILSGTSNSLNLRSVSQKVFVILTDTQTEGTDLDNTALKNQVDQANAQVYVLGINNRGFNNWNYYNQHFGEYATDILVPESSSDISENLTPNLADEIIKNSNVEHTIQKDLIIHAGANGGQQITIPLYDNRAVAIGINSIDVTDSYDMTMEGLRRVDIANKILAERRSIYGALSNRMEHAYNNVKNTEENLIAAESQLRDADMAKEMTKLHKNQVLLQSSQSMMAQINQMSQSILQVLK
ncbi:flagellin N-terminal helical domain-containing protein [Solibacillus silvestris]|uniref:flagellin N-terminal helical domain-containing protein n=1 Tax=Solibacillus silvestris TaxID=76853 RepID=UPI003F815198